MRRFSFFLVTLICLASCGPAADSSFNTTPVAVKSTENSPASSGPNLEPFPDAFKAAQALGRGLNLGDALEAPKEGAWGVIIEPGYFELIKKAGFDSVRIPIRWEAHAAPDAPYTIDPPFFVRVDQLINGALEQDLVVILDFHNYPELMTNPQGHQERYLALWQQIAGYYKSYPSTLLFELLNEPGDQLDAAQWNALSGKALNLVRQSNPSRNVILGGANLNGYDQLEKLELPQDDRHLIVTFHYYNPFEFTHQGADWVAGMDAHLGTSWEASQAEKAAISAHFDQVADWAKTHDRPILLGEFGAYSEADMDSRVRWTSFVARQAEKHGFAWAYWEFCSKFGIYDPDADVWREPLLKALVPWPG